MMTNDDKGGGGVKNSPKNDDVIFERPHRCIDRMHEGEIMGVGG